MKTYVRLFFACVIILWAGVIGYLIVPSVLDWTVEREFMPLEDVDYQRAGYNYILEGRFLAKYNGTVFIDASRYGLLNISTSQSHRFFYKECTHTKGDKVRYAGFFNGNQFYTTDFILKRELC